MKEVTYISAAFSASDNGHLQAKICSTTILGVPAGVTTGSGTSAAGMPPSDSESSMSSSSLPLCNMQVVSILFYEMLVLIMILWGQVSARDFLIRILWDFFSMRCLFSLWSCEVTSLWDACPHHDLVGFLSRRCMSSSGSCEISFLLKGLSSSDHSF